MSVCTSTLKATPPERQRAISSPSPPLERKSPPAPPYSGGNSRPRKPSSPSRRQKARGIRPALSHSGTKGVTSFSTKARMLFRSISCSGVKRGLTLPPEPPGDRSRNADPPFHEPPCRPVHGHPLGVIVAARPRDGGVQRKTPGGMAEGPVRPRFGRRDLVDEASLDARGHGETHRRGEGERAM